MSLASIRAEDEVFASEGQIGIGAVRVVHPASLLVQIEGYGEIEIGPEHIASAHDGKVLLNLDTLDQKLRDHIAHAHDQEYRNPGART